VVALNTSKMMHETGLAKMYLAGQEVAGAGEVDIAHIQDSYLMNSGPPARGEQEAGQVEVDIGRKPLQA
jgi:hypothetical protein